MRTCREAVGAMLVLADMPQRAPVHTVQFCEQMHRVRTEHTGVAAGCRANLASKVIGTFSFPELGLPSEHDGFPITFVPAAADADSLAHPSPSDAAVATGAAAGFAAPAGAAPAIDLTLDNSDVSPGTLYAIARSEQPAAALDSAASVSPETLAAIKTLETADRSKWSSWFQDPDVE